MTAGGRGITSDRAQEIGKTTARGSGATTDPRCPICGDDDFVEDLAQHMRYRCPEIHGDEETGDG